MESYFFSLNMKTILQPDNILDFFRRHYRVRAYDTIHRKKRLLTENDRFSLDNRVVIQMFSAPNGIRFTFESCFGNYENNMIYIFEVVNALANFGMVELILPDRSAFILPINFNEFYRVLNHSHEEKYKLFLTKYGNNMHRICLPNEFYKKLLFK